MLSNIHICRRDSFITHRAFCDALAEENNKMNQGMLESQQIPDHYAPSMPMSTGNSMSMGLPQFNNYNLRSPLKMHPHELQMPYESMNMSGGLFSSSSGTLLSNPRGVSSSTSGLELSSSNRQSGFGGPFSEAMAQMSATALLQKAAQIGATASNVINSPMMQKSYITSMAAPDQPISDGPSPRQSYFDVQGSFHNIHSTSEGNNAFQKPNPQDELGPGTGAGTKPILGGDPVMNDVGIYSDIIKGNNNSNLIQARADSGLGRHMPGAGSDTLTVDFLGIGGSRSVHMQEQHRLGAFEETNHQDMQAMNSFQELMNQDSSTHQKPIWEEYGNFSK